MINFLDSVNNILVPSYDCSLTKLFPIFQATKFAIVVVQIAVPFGLIIFGSLDFFKALIAHDEKEMRLKRKPFIQRMIAGVTIFTLPITLQMLSTYMAGKDDASNFWKCYHQAKAKLDFRSWQGKKVTKTCAETTVASGYTMEKAGLECAKAGCVLDKYDQDANGGEGAWVCRDKPIVTETLQELKGCTKYAGTSKACTVAENGDACELKKTTTKKKKKGKTVKKTTYKCVKKEDAKRCADYGANCPAKDDYYVKCESYVIQEITPGQNSTPIFGCREKK